jgi:hypothetical protein
MLISILSCAPVYCCVDLFSIYRLTALDLVKICNFQLCVARSSKVFDLGSLNVTGMLISIFGCAPVYFCVDLLSIYRVMALDLVKICNFQLVSHIVQKVFDLKS